MLQDYDFEIVHKPGKANTNADALSRTKYPEPKTAPVTDDIPSPPLPSRQTYAQVVACPTPPINKTIPTPNSSSMPPSRETYQDLYSKGHLTSQVTSTLSPLPSDPSSDSDLSSDPPVPLAVDFYFANETVASGPAVMLAGYDIDDEHFDVQQYNSPDLRPIIDYLSNGEIPPSYTDAQVKGLVGRSQEYVIKDNIIYHFYQPKFRGSKTHRPPQITQVVVPLSKLKDLLYAYHDSKVGGCNLGIDFHFSGSHFQISLAWHVPRH